MYGNDNYTERDSDKFMTPNGGVDPRHRDNRELPKKDSDGDFERMTKEAGLETETLFAIENSDWRRQINECRQKLDYINTSIQRIAQESDTALTCAKIRRQSFVVERRFIDDNCKPYLFIPKDLWQRYGLRCGEWDSTYVSDDVRMQKLTDDKGADLVAIRFDDPRLTYYAGRFEANVNALRDKFRGYKRYLKESEELIHPVKFLPAGITVTFQLYYIKLTIDIAYAKSREINDWGTIGQDYGGEDLVSRTTDIEAYFEYPVARYYGVMHSEVWDYVDYLNTKEREYQRNLQKTGQKDEWELRRLLASNDDADVCAQFLLFDRLIQDFEYHEQYEIG